MSMLTKNWSMSIGIVTTNIISTSMGRTRRPASRIPTGTGTRLWCIGIRIIPTCITVMAMGARRAPEPATFGDGASAYGESASMMRQSATVPQRH